MTPGAGRPGPRCVSIAYTEATSDARVRRHCEALARRGWRVYQLGLGAPGERAVGRLNGVVLVRWLRPRYRGGRLLSYAAAYAGFMVWAWRVLARIGRRGALDVVQSNNVPCALVFAATAARRSGAGIVLDVHDPEPELARSKFGDGVLGRSLARALALEERLSSRRADVVLCVHEDHAEVTRRHGVHHPRLHCVLNTADERLFPLGPPRPASPHLVYHGMIAPRMGLDVVLRALRRLRDAGREVRATFVGDGDAVADLVALRDALGLAGSVRITGRRVRPEALASTLADAGVGVVPLLRDPITDLMLPTKLLEFIRLGIPTVVVWTPTIGHHVPEDTVRYVRDFTPEAVAAAVAALLDDPAEARRRVERAQRLPVAQPWQAHEGAYVGHVLEAAAEGAHRAGRRADPGLDAAR